MVELFRIANGPWERLFSGNFQNHETEIYLNPDKIALVLVYEKKLDTVEGAIVEIYKILHANGDVESFTETLPKEAIIITKHNEKETNKFLLLGSKPTYVRWVSDEFTSEVDSMVNRLTTSSSMIKDVSKAYELELKEIADSSEDVQNAFFAEPMLVPMFTTNMHTQQGTTEHAPIKNITKGEIILGITRDKKRVIEPVSLFSTTIVTEGREIDRNRVLQVVVESALLSKIPAVVFDFDNKFNGLGEANRDASEMQKYDVNIDPFGFPIRKLRSGDDLKININLTDGKILSELFGVGERDFTRIVEIAMKEGEASTMDELVERISKMKATEEFSEFKISKVARIMRLIDIRYPNLFGGESSIARIADAGSASIARVSLLEFGNMDNRGSQLLFYTILRGINEYYKNSKKGKNLNLLVVIENNKLKTDGKGYIGTAQISTVLKEFDQHGIGLAIESERLSDIESGLRESATAKINIVHGNDVGVQLQGRKAYRALIRPTLSKQSV